MDSIAEAFAEAWKLLTTLNMEIAGIILLTLFVTFLSTGISAACGIPAGIMLGSSEFKGRKLIVRIVGTFMGLPPVIAGLVVYLLLSSKGPFGSLQLLFTPAAMIIAQVLIVFPIITGLVTTVAMHRVAPIKETCIGLGVSKTRMYGIILHECRFPVLSALLAGFGRAISEVGAVMLVGGNIQYSTRVMTTSIVLETGKGNYGKALALGLFLLAISFLVNWVVQKLQEAI